MIDFGVPLGVKMEPKIDQQSIIFQVGVPEGPRGRFWKDFRPFWELFWDDFSKVFGRISMLGLIVFKWLLLRSGGSGGRYRCVAATLLDMIWGWSCTLFVMIFHMLIDVLTSHFETITFVCWDTVRVSVWSVVMVWFLDLCSGLLCSIWFSWYGFLWSWPSVLIDCSWSRLSGRFCLCWFGGIRTLLVWSSWYTLFRSDLVCSVLLCPSLVCSLSSALVWSMRLCFRQACSR